MAEKKDWQRWSLRRLAMAAAVAALCALLAGCGSDTTYNHEHDWVEATCEKPRKCRICGEIDGDALGHNWAKATCISPKRCSICGKTEGKKSKEHLWEEATCISPKRCFVCGKTEGKKANNHIWGEATCTEREKCVNCGKDNLHSEPLGHDWKAATLDAPMECNRCGITEGEPVPLSSFNRGRYDRWKARPTAEQYVGLSGYIAVTHLSYLYEPDSMSPYENDWSSEPWYATTYEKDKQLWRAAGAIEHKTQVKVIGQELNSKENGAYSYTGFLLVEQVENGNRAYIAVTDFVTEPYWEKDSVLDIGWDNPCLAIYHQKSDYYPVDRDNRKYDIANGETVLIYGNTDWGGIDRETNQIDALGMKGRGYFNADDLTIIY